MSATRGARVKVGDVVCLNDLGIDQLFSGGVALSHMKTLKMKVTRVGTESLTAPELTFDISVDNKDIDALMIDDRCFDVVK